LNTPLSAGSPNFRGVADAKGNTGLAGLERERRDLVAEWKAKDKQLIGARGNLRGSAIQLGPDEALVLFLDTQEIKLTVPEETFIWAIKTDPVNGFYVANEGVR